MVERKLAAGIALVSMLAIGATPAVARADATPNALTTEHAGDGVFTDVARPRLSWQDRGDGQRAYENVVTDGRRVVWDSGRVASAEQTDVVYGGPALASNGSYEWSVRVWDEGGRPSGWSR